MSEYKNIRGKKVKFLTSDLSGAEAEGQIFYNDTDNDFKSVVASAAWSAGANLITISADLAGAGSTSAGLAFGGTPASGVTAATAEYNGTGWIVGGNMGTARRSLGGGVTQTAGLAIGGYVSGDDAIAIVEEYNGTAWSEQNDIPAGSWKPGMLGVQTAAVSMGGKVVTPEASIFWAS